TTAPAARGKDSSITVDLTGDAHGEWVAHVGISVAEGFDQLDDKSLAQLRSLHPRHLRLELDLTSGGWQEKLASYRDNLKSIGAPIEAALICPDRPAGVLKELAA